MTPIRTIVTTSLLACGIAGWFQSQKTLSPDLGVAVRQDVVAQIADPQATYGPPPPADGMRANLAQTRYKADKPVQSNAQASEFGAKSGVGQSSSGGSGGGDSGGSSLGGP
ncbi:hypothetical protein [Phenylobacterium montanum]|uniref:Uncharacterized protein n=1 Tax=Phenylobacterium montanum TaxID=2823693 RepID=A0A975G115_9CAUL|nr:hypothetical protein [Caulobacter sp. S6]QUD88582.1 hypothetical protein KCG34_01435 [Caulobacter sp. S6]